MSLLPKTIYYIVFAITVHTYSQLTCSIAPCRHAALVKAPAVLGGSGRAQHYTCSVKPVALSSNTRLCAFIILYCHTVTIRVLTSSRSNTCFDLRTSFSSPKLQLKETSRRCRWHNTRWRRRGKLTSRRQQINREEVRTSTRHCLAIYKSALESRV